ncbi:MAG: ine55 [Parcubacteria group bacterium]|nr:ine55 [Parcubacteria group bacterium]
MLTKKIGETPLEALTDWKARHPRYKDVPASYAGRLDPMASGKLLVLLGEECKRQTEYTKLDKTYEIEVLLDIGSDTGDILGIVEASKCETTITKIAAKAVLQTEVGTHTIPYPIYSSKTVNGKPLFLYALEGTLDTIELPTHEETIHRIVLKGLRTVSNTTLKERIETLLALAPVSTEPSKALGADFRIVDVRRSWAKVFEAERQYEILKLKVECGSGTYMRSLAGRIGKRLGTRALALSIRRTKIKR